MADGPPAGENPESLLNETLFPDDAYERRTYWADLPRKQKLAWVNRQAREESGRELASVWEIFKKDPLRPFSLYFQNYVVTGMGFFTEGYTLFSVGNLLTLFEAVWPECYKNYQVCSSVWVQAINYLEIVGIILGQTMIGIVGDWIGRRWGIIQDAVTMCLGATLLTAMWGRSLYGWTIMYALALLVFGIGVGGEYPMTSITAMEGVRGQGTTRADKLHRGRTVTLSFLMQGWGQVINQVVLILCMLVFHGGGNPPYSKLATQWTFRVSFAFIVAFLVYLIYLPSRQRSNVTGYDVKSLKLVSSHYWHRLVGTSLCWFCNDFPFYGNQIFRNAFLKIVTSNSDEVVTQWLWNLTNVGCELVGYYLASMLIDYKLYGRKRMQAVGFLMSFILFIIAAAAFPILDVPGPGGHGFEFIYFFSSFWIQFGPNSTTFILAAEVYPAPVRATAHGVSAAVGKLGALAATILYNYISARVKFWVVSWFGLIGFILTVVFIPDTTGLDLREQERYWQFVREGREQEYHGIAIHPRHLSLYERVILKRGNRYDGELDRQMKMDELRKLYEKVNEATGKEEKEDDRCDGDCQRVQCMS
ncbi:MFS general substrate transporter [Rhizodiscina lignyota]|uniref:MFS general substrate transporter n=1 Tax=Rhizodiscina lignyota TaxID=1504668 RepID=A0A9P4M3A5_9PEZI|nr:MFS general substrate transporter [Rhizodiscina lignyota]